MRWDGKARQDWGILLEHDKPAQDTILDDAKVMKTIKVMKKV